MKHIKQPLTEKLLLFFADCLDFNDRLSSRSFTAMPDDPRFNYHKKWMREYLENRRKKQKLHVAIKALKRRGFLQEKVFANSQGYVLSEKGKNKILMLKIKGIEKEKIKNEDWLMVLFDIPERYRKNRDLFRKNLHTLGFEQLQKSVWITPYDVINELKKLIKFLGLEEFAKFMFVREIKK